jgi:putative transposase
MTEGQFYHIYNRGNNKEKIFFEEKNHDYFLQQFNKYLSDKINIYAYCLMPNHFHFLIKVQSNSNNKLTHSSKLMLSPLEKSFKDFFISYAKSINKMYERTGSLFQYKFKRKIIENYNYLTRLIPYIHQNPVRSGLCCQEEDWKYSSYSQFINKKDPFYIKVNVEEILDLYNGINGFKEYHNNYKDYIKERDLLFKN